MHPQSLLAPGVRFDRYELICPIAEGGMASVWIARQKGKHGFERLVAIKTILPKYASEARFQSMFLDEARLSSRIEHDNVAQILDVGEQHDTTYLVMEYVDGDAFSTIHRTVKKKGGRVPPGVLLRVMADVCGGLHAAHELRGTNGNLLGVVHRDVTPHNILVGSNGDAKLIDFGIAKARDRLTADTNTGTIKGKVRYMAPEQALGGAVDRRADIWGIGANLYDSLAGRPPYDGGNDVQTLLALTSGRPPLPLPASVPRSIVRVVTKALTADPARRFATAAEMQQAIEEAMAEASLATSISSVAAFVSEHMSERAHRRKSSISLGLKAAAERDQYASILRSSVRTMASTSTLAEGDPRGDVDVDIDVVMSEDTIPQDGTIGGGTLGSAAMGLGLRRAMPRKTIFVVGLSVLAAAVGLFALTPSKAGRTTPAAAPAESAVLPPPATANVDTQPPVLSADTTTADPPVTNPVPAPIPNASAASARPTPRASASAHPVGRPAAPEQARPLKSRVDDGF